MNDMEESRKFESAFKNAFDEANVDPSENVWTNIELDLARAEGGEMKRRLLFYKLLAAASVTFAMCVAGVGYYVVQKNSFASNSIANANQSVNVPELKQDQTNQSVNTTEVVRDETKLHAGNNHQSEVTRAQSSSSEAIAESQSLQSDRSTTSAKSFVAKNSNTNSKRNNNTNAMSVATGSYADEANHTVRNLVKDQASIAEASSLKSSHGFATLATERFEKNLLQSSSPMSVDQQALNVRQKLPRTISSDALIITPVEVQPDPLALMLARLDDQEKEMNAKNKADKKANGSENLWTSVGFSAGGFSTVNASGSVPASSSLQSVTVNKVADRQTKASGMAYSIGVSMGTKLSDRWVIQGGVNYMAQSSDYTANAVVTADYENFYSGSLNEVQSADSKFLNSAPYNVNNNVQFVSVPVQAGYLIIDKRFGVQMNAGVATDLFLQNTITPESEVLPKTTQGRGEESPYRPVNFSGLLGTELSYRLGQHYRMAINPAIRYPFNSIYKSELGIKSMPLTFDVGLKFRYIFH